MTDKRNLNLITTACGKQYVIDFLDQVALGIFDSAEYSPNSLFIPPTYSLYKTVSEEYVLEITQFNIATHLLETNYKLIDEKEAIPFLESGTLNVLLH